MEMIISIPDVNNANEHLTMSPAKDGIVVVTVTDGDGEPVVISVSAASLAVAVAACEHAQERANARA